MTTGGLSLHFSQFSVSNTAGKQNSLHEGLILVKVKQEEATESRGVHCAPFAHSNLTVSDLNTEHGIYCLLFLKYFLSHISHFYPVDKSHDLQGPLVHFILDIQ